MATAYLLLKTKGPEQTTTEPLTCSMVGDVIDILPVSPLSIGTKDLNFFVPIIVNDISIPCGDGAGDAAGTFTVDATGFHFKCSACKYNDDDLCGRIKFLRALWDGGDIDNPPRIIRKRRDWADVRNLPLSTPIKNLLFNTNKTQNQMDQIMSWVNSHPMSIAIVQRKLS